VNYRASLNSALDTNILIVHPSNIGLFTHTSCNPPVMFK
jgi:hypothetical protein